jgi:hypothetical protein
LAYSAEISRANPTCFLFVIDQSGSMGDSFGGGESPGGRSKAQELADAINRLLQALVTRSAKGEEVRNYFEVCVLGYGQQIGPVLQGPLAGKDLVTISEIAFNPVRLENRMKKTPDGAGGLVEQNFQLPIWLDPIHNGGTPMCDALRRAKGILDGWAAAHPLSYPPAVIHITDGESTDGDPSSIASELRSIKTQDGNLCLFNLHLSSTQATPITCPDSDVNLPDQFARLLFSMSSSLPGPVRTAAQNEGYRVTDGTRGFGFNANLVETVRFLDIGTRVSGLR